MKKEINYICFSSSIGESGEKKKRMFKCQTQSFHVWKEENKLHWMRSSVVLE